MAFPATLTNAVDGVTEIVAAHLNNLEAKVGIDGSAVATSLDYLVKNVASLDPGHKHSALWASDGSPQAIGVDAAGAMTFNQLAAAGFLKTSAAGLVSTGAIASTDLPMAVQADQEAGTSTAKLVSPGVQKFHPGAGKAWLCCDISGNITGSYNIASITDAGTGVVTADFTQTFSSNGVGVVGMCFCAGALRLTLLYSLTSTTIQIRSYNTSFTAADPDGYTALVCGDFA